MNILFVSGISQIGGGETVLEEYVKQLHALGHSVTVVMGLDRDQRNWSKPQLPKAVKVLEYKVNFQGNLNVYWSVIKGVWQALHRSRQQSLDLIVINATLAGLSVYFHPAFIGTKKVFLFHGDEVKIMQSIENDNAAFSLKIWLKKGLFLGVTMVAQYLNLFLAQHIIVFSAFMKRNVLDKWVFFLESPSKVKVVYLGVDTDQFKPLSPAKRTTVRKKLKLEGNKVILCTSRFEPRKGIDLLLAAFAEVRTLAKKRKRSQPPFLVLATSMDEYYKQSGYNQSLFSYLKEHDLTTDTKLIFNSTRDTLTQYYQAADIHVLPSRELEAFGLVTLEALACGLPVITFKSAGAPPEMLSQLNPAYIVPQVSSQKLAETIYTWLYKKPRSEKKQVAFAQNFSWTASVEKLLAVIK